MAHHDAPFRVATVQSCGCAATHTVLLATTVDRASHAGRVCSAATTAAPLRFEMVCTTGAASAEKQVRLHSVLTGRSHSQPATIHFHHPTSDQPPRLGAPGPRCSAHRQGE